MKIMKFSSCLSWSMVVRVSQVFSVESFLDWLKMIMSCYVQIWYFILLKIDASSRSYTFYIIMVDNSSSATDFSPVDERKKYIF